MSCRVNSARVALRCAAGPLTKQCPCQKTAPVVFARSFASGPHFEGFPFGGGFGGGAPPRGDNAKFYKLLEVDTNASENDLKKAYKKQAMKHHPDRGGDEDTFKSISRAYEVLIDPEKKQIYDQYGEEGLNTMETGAGAGGGPAADPFDLFSQIFGFNAGGRQQRGKPTTPDSSYELQMTLEELYNGTSREIAFTRDALCGTCNGEGGEDRKECKRCGGSGRQIHQQQMGLFVQSVQTECSTCSGAGYIIPPGKKCKTCKGKCTCKEKSNFSIDIERGCASGTEFRFRGQADQAPGHETGDVVITVSQQPHKIFQRIDSTLLMSKKITLAEALCGFQFSMEFLDGKELVVQSKPGQCLRPNDMMVIEGKGMPRPHGATPGDLYIVMDVEFPDSIPGDHHNKILEVLGGEKLPEVPPLDAKMPRKLTQRQKQDMKRKLQANQQKQEQGGQRAQQCSQQ